MGDSVEVVELKVERVEQAKEPELDHPLAMGESVEVVELEVVRVEQAKEPELDHPLAREPVVALDPNHHQLNRQAETQTLRW